MADTKAKGMKRKRNTDDIAKPSKKVVSEGRDTLKFAFQEEDKWTPIIASTPGVQLPKNIALHAYLKPRNKASGRGRAATSIAEVLLHSSAHPTIDFTLREEELGGEDSLSKHYVGVYDPAMGTLHLVETRKMVARGVVRSHQASEEEVTFFNNRQLRQNLGQTFGTKKAKKAILSSTENAIGPAKSARRLAEGEQPRKLDSASAAILASMAEATTGMATRDQLQEEADAAKPRPRANLQASNVKDVYTIESLIGTELLKIVPVLEWQQALKAEKEFMLSSRFVSNRIQMASSNVTKLRLLRYMLLLLEFYLATKKRPRGSRSLPKPIELKTKLGKVPEALVESVKRKFSSGGEMSRFQADLLITHLCALACVVDNFEVDMWDLKEDLKLEGKEMQNYFHEIGSNFGALPDAQRKALGIEKAVAAQRKIAKLRLPLDFPKVNFGRKR